MHSPSSPFPILVSPSKPADFFKGLLASYKDTLKAYPWDLLQALRKHYKAHAYSDNSLSRQICQRTWMMLAYWLQHYFHIDFADVTCPPSLPESREDTVLADFPWMAMMTNLGGVSGMMRLVVDFINDVSASPLQQSAKKITEVLQVS